MEEGFFGYVGTAGRDRLPHVTPVIFVYDGRNVFFVTSKAAKKLRNIRQNSKIAFLVDIRDPSNLYNNRAVLILGRAKVYGLLDVGLSYRRMSRIKTLFYHKYPQYMRMYETKKGELPTAWRTTLFVSRILVRVHAERIVYWREARPIPRSG